MEKTLVKWDPVAQIPQSHIPQCTFCNRNVHMCAHFCYKMVHFVTHAHLLQNGAFWDMGLVHCGICEMGILGDTFLRWI